MSDIKHDNDWLGVKLRKLYDGASKKAKLDDEKFLSFAEIAVSICKAYHSHMKSNEWIPMSTPPEDGQVVDVVVDKGAGPYRVPDMTYCKDEGVFETEEIWDTILVSNATHYMPAPTLPEVE